MNNKKFLDKNVLITGGSKGIGKSICEKFAKEGANVIYTYRKNDKSVKILNEYSKKITTKYLVIQIKNSEDKNLNFTLRKIYKKHQKINFLINNVGDAIKRTKFVSSNDKLWKDSIDINLMSAVRTSKNIIKIFKKSKLDAIINIGSIAGKTFGQGDPTLWRF